MQITITLTDILVAAGIIVPLGCSGLYLSTKLAIRSAVRDLELEVARGYMSKATCKEIRDACERHRHEVAAATAAAAGHRRN